MELVHKPKSCCVSSIMQVSFESLLFRRVDKMGSLRHSKDFNIFLSETKT